MSLNVAATMKARLLVMAKERGAEVGEEVRDFLHPVRDSILSGYPLEKHRPAGGTCT